MDLELFYKKNIENRHFLLNIIFLIIAVFFIISFTGQILAQTETEEVLNWQPYDQALIKSEVENIPTIIYFYSDDCGWCRKLEEETFGNKEVIELLNKGFAMVKVNGNSNETVLVGEEKMTESRLSTEVFQVRGFPTIWFLSSNNDRIANLPGYVPTDMFLPILVYVRDGIYKELTFQEYMDQEKDTQE